MAFKKGQSGNLNGRGKGTPNKTTQEAREAIAKFVEGNADRLQEWLDAVAKGVDKDGTVIGPPSPEKAFNLFQSVIEYHVPKLARQEITGKDGQPLAVQILDDING